MANDKDESYELQVYQEIVTDIKEEFKSNEIDAMIRIYRWTKSERNRYFFTQILKRIPNYKKALKKLISRYFVRVVRSNDPHKITNDGIRVGGLWLLLRNLDLL